MKSNDFPESTPKAPLDSDAVSTNSIPQNGDLLSGNFGKQQEVSQKIVCAGGAARLCKRTRKGRDGEKIFIPPNFVE